MSVWARSDLLSAIYALMLGKSNEFVDSSRVKYSSCKVTISKIGQTFLSDSNLGLTLSHYNACATVVFLFAASVTMILLFIPLLHNTEYYRP